MGGVSTPTDDSLDRFERVLDQQLAAIEDIDQKAEHVTRFVTPVLGVVLSVASVLSRLDPAAFDPGWASVVAFSISILGLVGAVAGAILTYQSSRIRIGLHHEAARTVANVNLRRRQYDEMVLRAYAALSNKTGRFSMRTRHGFGTRSQRFFSAFRTSRSFPFCTRWRSRTSGKQPFCCSRPVRSSRARTPF